MSGPGAYGEPSGRMPSPSGNRWDDEAATMHSQSGYRKSHRKGSDGSGSQRGAGQEEGSSAGTYPLQLPPFEPRTGTYAMHTAGQASGASNMDRYGSAEYDSDGAYANVGQSRAWKSYALANVGSNQYEGPGVWPNYDSPPNGASASSSSVPENSKPAGRQAGHEKAKPAARPRYNRNDSGSWSNLLKGAGYESAANASSTNLAHDGDVHDGKGFSGRFRKLLASSIAVRWLLYILPVVAILWIPGIVALVAYGASGSNGFDRPTVWSVGLVWWSIWLSAVWVGWWGCWLVAKLLPRLLTHTIGVVATELKHYIAYLTAIERYVAFFLWTVLVWIVWLSVIWNHFQNKGRSKINPGDINPLVGTNSTTNGTTTGMATSLASADSDTTSQLNLMVTIGRFWFGLVICAAILLGEKLLIQVIAYNFHRVSYESRIAQNKFHIKVLTTLYSHSRGDLHRKDTYLAAEAEVANQRGRRKSAFLLSRQLRKTRERVKEVAQQSTSVLGTVASEIAGQSVLQPNSPRSIVVSALGSPKQTRQLARRIFYSFCPSNRTELIVDDIVSCFPDATTAEAAFEVFDKDFNHDVSLDELEMGCMEIHRERLALTSSMRDVDSAVGRLDNIFMSLYVLISAVIVAALLSVKFSTLITSFGTIILGLSWLVGTTAQEIIASIIWLFVKHPYDVGDRVDIGDDSYVVKEMKLLSTVFKKTDGKYVQISNAVLATKPVVNIRRSGAIEETFKFDVAFSTTFEQIEKLRNKMVEWLDGEQRDFLPGLDITIDDFPEQSGMTLKTGIRYKSNWQVGALKAQRRNRFLCTLKTFLHELKIWGPEGDPDAEKAVQKVTLLPYPLPDSVACASANVSQVDRDDGNRSYHFMDRGSAINASVLDVFDGGDDVGTRSATPATDLETGRTTQSRTIHVPETTVAAETTRRTRPSQLAGEDIELRPRNVL